MIFFSFLFYISPECKFLTVPFLPPASAHFNWKLVLTLRSIRHSQFSTAVASIFTFKAVVLPQHNNAQHLLAKLFTINQWKFNEGFSMISLENSVIAIVDSNEQEEAQSFNESYASRWASSVIYSSREEVGHQMETRIIFVEENAYWFSSFFSHSR